MNTGRTRQAVRFAFTLLASVLAIELGSASEVAGQAPEAAHLENRAKANNERLLDDGAGGQRHNRQAPAEAQEVREQPDDRNKRNAATQLDSQRAAAFQPEANRQCPDQKCTRIELSSARFEQARRCDEGRIHAWEGGAATQPTGSAPGAEVISPSCRCCS